MARLLCGVLIAASVNITLVFAEDAARKSPVPDLAAQNQAQKLVTEIYKDDFAKSKRPEDKGVLARKLLKAAGEEQKDIAGRYVLLMLAKDNAAEAGNADTAFDVLAELDASFTVDRLAVGTDMMAAVVKSATTPSAQRAAVARIDALLDAAIQADRYYLAKRLADLALSAARKAADPALVLAATARSKDIATIEQAHKEAAKAMLALEKKPTDPAANAVVGKFRCFMKGDWDGGLPMLALGDDATLKVLAERELKGPEDAQALVALGDGWWDLAQKTGGTQKTQMLRRAVKCYTAASPNLNGLAKAKAEQRIQAAGPPPASSLPGPDLGQMQTARSKTTHLRRLDELNSSDHDIAPWLSPDGLTIYWTRLARGKPSEPQVGGTIWTATRKDVASRFENSREVLRGHSCVLTSDGLQMIYRSPETEGFCVAERTKANQPFGPSRLIRELVFPNGDPAPRWLSADGLVLYFDRRAGSYSTWVTTRTSRAAKWQDPKPVVVEIVSLPKGVRFAQGWCTSDRLHLFCVVGVPNRNGEEAWCGVLSRNDPTGPFTSVAPIVMPESERKLAGLAPRFIQTTEELFYVAPSPKDGDDLWVWSGFVPPYRVGTMPGPTR